MSDVAVRCVALPVREEVLSGAALVRIHGGVAWWPVVRQGFVIIVEGFLYDTAKAGVKRAWDWSWDQWDAYQAEITAEAEAENHHEFRAACIYKAG